MDNSANPRGFGHLKMQMKTVREIAAAHRDLLSLRYEQGIDVDPEMKAQADLIHSMVTVLEEEMRNTKPDRTGLHAASV